MRRTSRWLCTTLRVPTSAQGNTRAVNEFPVPPVFFLVLQCGLIFFTLISLVPWQNWAILSYSVDPWKKPRAEIWNAKQIMRFLSSLPFFRNSVCMSNAPCSMSRSFPTYAARCDLIFSKMQCSRSTSEQRPTDTWWKYLSIFVPILFLSYHLLIKLHVHWHKS